MSGAVYRDELADQPMEFRIASTKVLHDGFRRLDEATVFHQRLDGEGEIGPLRREYLATGDIVVIIPYDPKLESIVVIRQFRIGSALAIDMAAALELPAGLVDAGEDRKAAARRELEEETGLSAIVIGHCFDILSSPGLTSEHASIYLAIVDASSLATSAGKAEESEDIRPILAPVDALVEAVDQGRVRNGFLVGSTHWFARRGRAMALALSGTVQSEE